MPLQFTILSEKLKVADYASHFIGKGHLGWQTTDNLLINRGFESHVGYLGGSESYEYGNGNPNPYVGSHDMWHNEGPGVDIVPMIRYSTNFYSNYAVDKILMRNKSKPLWIHVAYQAMHGGQHREEPLPEDYIDPQAGFRNKGYGNALVSLDHGIKNGIWENTLLITMSDNGGDNPGGLASNYPLLGRKCLAWEGGTRVFAFVSGGLVPPELRGSTNDGLFHIADWYATFSFLAGVEPTDRWLDPETNKSYDIDGENLWPSLMSGGNIKLNRQWLPTTPQSLIHVDGQKMWKLITNETQAVRFYKNGSTYMDPHNGCLSPPKIIFDCVDSLGENGGGGQMRCEVCTPTQPCLFELTTDPLETSNVASENPTIVSLLESELQRYQKPYVLDTVLSQENLACYNCSFDPEVKWHNFTGPKCLGKRLE
eukprot:UC4_evm1s1050